MRDRQRDQDSIGTQYVLIGYIILIKAGNSNKKKVMVFQMPV